MLTRNVQAPPEHLYAVGCAGLIIFFSGFWHQCGSLAWQESLRDHSVTATSTSMISLCHLRSRAPACPRGGGWWLPCPGLAHFPRSGEAPHATRTPRPLWQDATKSSVTSAGCCHFFGSRYSSPSPSHVGFLPDEKAFAPIPICRCPLVSPRYKISRSLRLSAGARSSGPLNQDQAAQLSQYPSLTGAGRLADGAGG